jgi:hypothetical protein
MMNEELTSKGIEETFAELEERLDTLQDYL